jgi:SAM-dependent methyltransferase
VFERSETSLARILPIRKTISGIWVPTPVGVIENGLAALTRLGLLPTGAGAPAVIDAGTGDGRVAAFLATFEPACSVYAIEQDQALFAQAMMNLHTLRAEGLVDDSQVHLVEADYCAMTTYEACGLDLRHVGLVFNYPDGNQKRLAQFLSERAGPDTQLCLLTHDRSLALDEPELRVSVDVEAGDEPSWLLAVYGKA